MINLCNLTKPITSNYNREFKFYNSFHAFPMFSLAVEVDNYRLMQ